MLFTLIAMISVAISGRPVGVGPTVSPVTEFPRPFGRLFDEIQTHDCRPDISAHMMSISIQLVQCLGTGRWGIVTDRLDTTSPAFCCFIYDTNRIANVMLDRQCIRVSGKPNAIFQSFGDQCKHNGIDLNDTYCEGQPSRRLMSIDCDFFVYDLKDGRYPSFPSPSSATTRPLPAMGLVLLVAIVASIAVFMYGF